MTVYGLMVVRLEGQHVGPGQIPPPGTWVKEYNPDAYNGRGDVVWTMDPMQAKAFPHQVDAYLYYTQVSTVQPTRPYGDHGPNRPLTAFTMACEPIPGRD